MNREYHKWYSPNIGRDMELLVFGSAGARVIVFPTRDGRFFDYENWRMVDALKDKIEAGYLQLYCVDSIDRESLYADWAVPPDRMKRHLDFEKYILEEVAPFSAEKNPNYALVAHGCSLGAYHAMNITLRHPDHFAKVVAFSGRYDLTYSAGSFRGLFDDHYDDLVYFNTPTHFLPNIKNESLLNDLRNTEIIFVIGKDDAFCENNRILSQQMEEKKIPHQFVIWDGEAHKPFYWRRMVRFYL